MPHTIYHINKMIIFYLKSINNPININVSLIKLLYLSKNCKKNNNNVI